MNVLDSSFYVAGGTLRHDAPSYVERQADKDLLEGLLRGEYCYVLTSRQMGKSSLMVRTAQKLREEGFAVAVLDLTSVGQNLTPEQWYGGLLTRLGSQTRLEDELDGFWWKHEALGPCQRFFTAIREVVLPCMEERMKEKTGGKESESETEYRSAGVSGNLRFTFHGSRSARLIVFVDELDVVRSLPFSTDEFFAAIRECFTRRTEDPVFDRLAFCLLGVATPSDLIRDTRLTPFNIGRRIELKDFKEDEALPLASALGRSPLLARMMLRRVLSWTGGHPYLTQRLCYAVASHPKGIGVRLVDRLCHEHFFSNRARERDDNLLFVRERLLRSEADLIDLLRLYRKVHRSTRIAGLFGFRLTLRKIEPVADEETNPLVSILRLSGVTKVENGILRVRNRIYYRVFDRAWVEANMPVTELWRRWLIVWGSIKRASKFIGALFLVLVLSGVALALWLRPWEIVHFDRPRTVRNVARPKPSVPPRDPRATPALIDLSSFYNAALNKTWHSGLPDNNLSALPQGLQTFGGVEFDVRGVVQLAGANLWRQGFPAQVRGIPVNQRCARLHFLHATGWTAVDGAHVGNYVIQYANGIRRFVPILYGQDVVDWRAQADGGSEKELETLVWKESPAPGSTDRSYHRIFKSTWANPFPDVEIQCIDFVSAMGDAAPFLIAITVEAK
ncbi:MAG: AAA-like domain-containing protein [Verrucomicrobia bacterium]|nr:AAA-like domain-containing protein [Verrucomicrobiota bacterium]